MSKILELYAELLKEHANDRPRRFIDEVFQADIYKNACPQKVIIDLGAYEGEFGFYCLNFASKIYAIEPDPAPYKFLKENVENFELGDKIQTFNFAIGGKNGSRKMTLSGLGGNAFASDEEGPIETKTLATFMHENNIDHVDILKIDVEGAEREIFEADDFKDVVGMIDYIIGEDHGNACFDRYLPKYGFTINRLPGGASEAKR